MHVFTVVGAFYGGLRALHFVEGGQHKNGDAVGLFKHQKAVALFVEQIVCHFTRTGDGEVFGFLEELILDLAQHAQTTGRDSADHAAAFAMRAGVEGSLDETRTQALARHFQKAEVTYTTDLNAGTVVLQGFLDAAFDVPVVAVLFHVDEVDDDEACKVAQAELSCNFIASLKIGFGGRVFDVVFARRLAGVDVDRHQGFGLVDHDITAGWQCDRG